MGFKEVGKKRGRKLSTSPKKKTLYRHKKKKKKKTRKVRKRGRGDQNSCCGKKNKKKPGVTSRMGKGGDARGKRTRGGS